MAALEYIQIGHGRCETFFISGDVHHEEMNMSKARAILGWKPETREKLGL
jgi:nucleoside-diphosphate-sugar epimerase